MKKIRSGMQGSNIYSPADLQKLPTLSTGHCCSLKLDNGNTRVWLCRVKGGVTVEEYKQDHWEIAAGGCTNTEEREDQDLCGGCGQRTESPGSYCKACQASLQWHEYHEQQD